jgi:hypothetical protein
MYAFFNKHLELGAGNVTWLFGRHFYSKNDPFTKARLGTSTGNVLNKGGLFLQGTSRRTAA